MRTARFRQSDDTLDITRASGTVTPRQPHAQLPSASLPVSRCNGVAATHFRRPVSLIGHARPRTAHRWFQRFGSHRRVSRSAPVCPRVLTPRIRATTKATDETSSTVGSAIEYTLSTALTVCVLYAVTTTSIHAAVA